MLHTGSALSLRLEYVKQEAAGSEDMLSFYRQVASLGMLLKLGETMMQLKPSGRVYLNH